MNTPKTTPKNIDGESALCTRCGLCCDGTLFNAVKVGPKEIAPLEQLGMVIDQSTAPQFSQPCVYNVDRCCAIYANRPATCRNFACALLKGVRAGTFSLPAAEAVVDYALALRAKAMATASSPGSIANWLVAVADTAWLEIADPAQKRVAAQHRLDLVVLGKFLDRHFRLPTDKGPKG